MSSTEHPNEAAAVGRLRIDVKIRDAEITRQHGIIQRLNAEVVRLSAENAELRAKLEALLDHSSVIGDYIHVNTLRSVLGYPTDNEGGAS